jgi:hypothetical protein
MSLWKRLSERCPRGTLPALTLALAGLLVQGGDAWGELPLGANRAAGLTLIAAAIVVGIVGIAAAVRESVPPPATGRNSRHLCWILAALLVFHTGAALHLLRSHDGDPAPTGQFAGSDPRNIDCYTFQLDAVKKLLHGVNPYGTTQANIYSAYETSHFYGPGMVQNGRVLAGLQYPPVTFLAALPGYLLGDLRYGYVLAVLLAAIFAFAAAPGGAGFCLAAYLLLNPITFMVEEHCWTEPLVWMLLCATLYAAIKRPRWLALALGLFLASKQYNFLALPLIGILPRPFTWKACRRLLGASLAVAFATLLPFAWLNLHALWHDLVLFHLEQPLRQDALSFGVIYPPYMKIGLLLLLAFLAWIARRGVDRTALFAAAFGVALLLVVSAGKQAFMNYYFLISMSLLLAAAALWPGSMAYLPMTNSGQSDRPPHECART